MKRIVIGGFISLIGSIWASAIILMAANNLTSEWPTIPGRLLTTIFELNMTFLFAFSITFVVWGIGLTYSQRPDHKS